MGIHRFYAFLRKTFPDLITQTLDPGPDSHIEGLYTDLNSVVHMITSRLFKYGLTGTLTDDDKVFQEMVRGMTLDEKKRLLHLCIGTFLYYSYLRVRPTKIYMMAADGVAPKAKMVQQRTRRFKSEDSTLEFFDNVVISPGTPFWDELEDYLRGEWLATYKDEFPADLNIIYSGHREPGEGEHKIFEQMNSDIRGAERVRTQVSFRPGKSRPYQVVLGADSDLVVVSMTKSNNIIFMRDNLLPKTKGHDPNAKNNIHVPDVLELAINTILRCPTARTVDEQDRIRHDAWAHAFNLGYEYVNLTEMRARLLRTYLAPNDIVDFVFISLFVGNDFLPPMPEFESVTVLAYTYFTDDDIELRFQAANEWSRQQAGEVLNPGRGRGRGRGKTGGRGAAPAPATQTKTVAPFNKDTFWDEFRKLERTWTYGDNRAINFDNARGILNQQTNEYEIYPLHPEPLTGTLKRVLLTRKKDAGRWTFVKEDVGSLIRILAVYRQLMSRIRGRTRGQSNSFIVEQKNRINYLNLLQFLQELATFGVQFLESNANNYKKLEQDGLVPDPLVKYAVGIVETSKKNKAPSLVPAAFTGLQRVMSFGIYDSRYADRGLPKQALDEMCRKWLEGAQWTLRYYSDGMKAINTEWFYPYFYSPSVNDLINFISERVTADVPGYPGIRFSLTDTEVQVQKINIAGSLTIKRVPDPEDPEETIYDLNLNRDFSGVVYIYTDRNDVQVAQYRLPNGTEKYIDLEKIHFTRGGKNLLQGDMRPDRGALSGMGFVPPPSTDTEFTEFDPNVERIDPTKLTLVELNRELLVIPLQKMFVLDDAIFDVVSDISRPYASVAESMFSIMSERALKLFLSPNLVDYILYKSPQALSDCFPSTFEEIKEGKFYDNAAVPKIPFPSPTRVQRAVAMAPALYDVEIARLNKTRKRERFIRSGKYGPHAEEIKKAYQRGRPVTSQTSMGYAAANIASNTRKRQDIDPNQPVKTDPFDLGGIGNTLGGIKPEYKAYYQTLLKKPASQVDALAKIAQNVVFTTVEAAESALYKGFVFQFPSGWLLPSELPINYKLLKSTFFYHAWHRGLTPYNGQRKLLINEILFLTKYGSLVRKVVYAGAAPGNHIPLVVDMFPHLEFDLWDTEPFNVPDRMIKARDPKGRITIFPRLFTHREALAYRGQGILFISDIRNLSTAVYKEGEVMQESETAHNQLLVDADNVLQRQLTLCSGALVSMLKFKLPFNQAKDEIYYPDGEIWLQPWAKDSSAETRLILDSRLFGRAPKTPDIMTTLYNLPMEAISETEVPFPTIKAWSIREYENKLFYFNTFVKPQATVQNSLGIREGEVRGLKANFDAAYEIYVWEQWLLGRFGQNLTLDQRKQATVMILVAVEKFLGKDMSNNKISNRERGTYNLPFL